MNTGRICESHTAQATNSWTAQFHMHQSSNWNLLSGTTIQTSEPRIVDCGALCSCATTNPNPNPNYKPCPRKTTLHSKPSNQESFSTRASASSSLRGVDRITPAVCWKLLVSRNANQDEFSAVDNLNSTRIAPVRIGLAPLMMLLRVSPNNSHVFCNSACIWTE